MTALRIHSSGDWTGRNLILDETMEQVVHHDTLISYSMRAWSKLSHSAYVKLSKGIALF